MIVKYIILFLISVLGGALGGLITMVVRHAVLDRRLRKWKPKEPKYFWVKSSKTNC